MAATIVGMSFPLLGVVMSMASSFIFGMFGSSQDSPEEVLYKTIMSQVEVLIEQSLIQERMTSVKNMLLGVSDEMAWIPDLLQNTSHDVQLSFYLSVQHDMAVNARDAFGDCYDSPTSWDCASWEEAGTIAITNEYAISHIETLNTLYSLTSSKRFTKEVQNQLMKVGLKYRGLLQHSFDAFVNQRKTQIELQMESYSVDGRGGGRMGVFKIKDISKNKLLSKEEEWFSGTEIPDYLKNKYRAVRDDARERLAKNIQASSLMIYPQLTSFVRCSVYSCPSGYVGKAPNLTEYSTAHCCDMTCAAFSCQAGYKPDAAKSGNIISSRSVHTANCCIAHCPAGQYAATWNNVTLTGTCAACTSSCPAGSKLDGVCAGVRSPACRDPYCSEAAEFSWNCNAWDNCNPDSSKSDNMFVPGSKTEMVNKCCKQGGSGDRRRCR
eukprot:TRINITY_DN77852_c0_g1_i1.p1 TRINITY_DN77852_c0_g1~~TRINITY_DN77852_c0_g1_i1.p1  ORF type:complete len:465 (+),score=77.54 TRINITY_DN77852_c0_g1_i1:87-1397(+)